MDCEGHAWPLKFPQNPKNAAKITAGENGMKSCHVSDCQPLWTDHVRHIVQTALPFSGLVLLSMHFPQEHYIHKMLLRKLTFSSQT